GHLGPGPDAYAVRLGDPTVHGQRSCRRLALRPHAFFKRTAEFGLMGLANQGVPLVVERRGQEGPCGLEAEVLARLPNAALAEREQLLTLGESAHGDGPFLESDRHKRWVKGGL